jgi:PAS domain S-box-containing protein
MLNQSKNDKESFIKRLAATGTLFVDTTAGKRNTTIANYFSIVLFCTVFLLLLIRNIFFNIPPDIKTISAGIFFLLPFVFNRFGWLFLARISLCWLPSILVMFIYITEGIRNSNSMLTSDFDSHRLYLLGFAVIPYLLLNLSNKKELIIGLSLPFLTLLFSYQLIDLFGLHHIYANQPGNAYKLFYFRTTIAYFAISGCCISMRLLVEKEDRRNILLIAELEEKNKLIDQRAEEEIRKSENMYRSLFEQGADAITLVDKNRMFKSVNSKACEMFGYSAEEFLTLKLQSIIAPSSLDEQPIDFEILKTYKTVLRERTLIKKDGTTFPAEINVRMLTDGNFQSFIRDATDRKEAEEENKFLQQQVLDQRIQEQKKITRAVLEAEEKEKNRIGQELHDNVNQILAGTRLYLELAARDDKSDKKLIASSLDLINLAIEEMRSLSKSQVTPFKGVDLEDLVYLLVEKLGSGSSIKTKIIYNIKNLVIEDGLKLNIYRILQEQITNILKHANASLITISLNDDHAFIYISIEDNGKGFDTEQKRKGIGISNMLNRIESFNGELKIDSNPGNGCRLQIKVPY